MTEYLITENNDFIVSSANENFITEQSEYLSYGVKYRLIFSDVLGNGKKVEILKKNYTGDVLPMIGGANPVQISWQSSDDFYKPIIGSKCRLSLLVTDTIQYDDFYKFDEREYKVVVSYAKSQGEIFADRVQADGGTVESFECVDNVLNNFETISTYYKNRVVDDGGNVESLSCVSDAITDNNFYRWGVYWSGFLVVDRFIETLQDKPFNVSFNAFDGLGTLGNFQAPIKTDYSPPGNISSYSDAERISLILSNLDLDLDLCYINDIAQPKIFNNPTNKYFPNTNTILPGFDEQIDGYEIATAKVQLENLLRTYNMRVYQSNNKWYIVEATNVFDVDVKNMIYNELQETGVVPTNIRSKITSALITKNNEDLKVYNYNSDGVFQSETKESFVYLPGTDIIPIRKDLKREYIQPISSVTTNSIDKNLTNASYNAGFEYGLNGFTVYNNYAEIATNEVAFQGNKSLKLSSTAPLTGQTNCFSPNNISITDAINEISNYELNFKYFIKYAISDTTLVIPASIQFRIRLELTSNPSTFYMWNYNNKEWVFNSIEYNSIQHNQFNQFETLNIKFTDEGLNFGSVPVTLKINIQNTVTSAIYYETTYFDNFEVINSETITPENSSLKSIINDNNFNTDKKTIKRLNPQAQTKVNGFYRTRDNYGTLTTTNLFKSLYEIENQNILNDYREFVIRYQGSFRNSKVKPMSFHNRIWFNWSVNDYDAQTSVIDRLTYNVKDSIFSIKAHVPNDDDDVPVINLIT